MGNYKEDVESNTNFRYLSKTTSSNEELNGGHSFTILDLEIERGCASSRYCEPRNSLGLCDGSDPDITLYKYNEIPHFLKGNPYVTTGYRAFLSSGLCLRSLFVWSNETINIWSHLLGFMLFAVLLVYDNVVLLPRLNGSLSDYIILSLGIFCYQFCMLCSAGFHLFACHSERASRRWLAVDLSGISVGLIGCYLPAVHYAFYCMSIWRDVYLLSIAVLSAVVLFFQFHREYFSPAWARHRMLLYLALAAYGIIPSVHWVFLNPGLLASEVVQLFLPKVFVMYMFGVVAFTVYLTKCPERCFPGKMDFVGSSHQLWHIIVVVAFYYWHNAGEEFLKYRLDEVRLRGECG